MKLTITYDGQFYVGIVETISENTLKAYRYVFGNEPKDQEVLDFVNNDLLKLITSHSQEGVPANHTLKRNINPKRLQRQAAKELANTSISFKAQEAIKKEYEQRKKSKINEKRNLKEEQKQYKWDLKKQKAKNKRKGK
ncbi:YjdF family protein [Neobacillus sp. OS1-32]|uniref:YjdF family protein n=1 Tax=Neobacillus sp. OS1-32 TaxID=3070682 RepID=UPI0027E09A92|nr:YjdF family protein [Neobacillus sp. OS1-32]WML31184.1 YjdF family protein [Neobacillus sp. OS1-32]